MPNVLNPGDGLIFMKVGVHASEPFEEIVRRKRAEFDKTGMTFWGYGGSTCHPIRQVQPFAKHLNDAGRRLRILMNEIESKHYIAERANEFSIDGVTWKEIPEGINVIGSRYALVLGELTPGELDLDLGATTVGIGTSRGKFGSDYIKGRVDKACLTYDPFGASPISQVKKIQFQAEVKAPYAVILR